MRIVSLVLVVAAATLAMSTPAFAWDFTCSPKETKDLTDQTPNVMLMLDRSGSMGDDDGILPNTCRVCESATGDLFEVASAADCPMPAAGGWNFGDYDESGSPGQNYAWSFTFTTPPVSQDMTLAIDIEGDFDNGCEWADVIVDGVQVGRIDRDGLVDDDSGCDDDEYGTFVFTVPQALASDGTVNVVVQTVGDNNDCDGNDGPGNCDANSSCDGVDDCGGANDNNVTVRLGHGNTYHGTLTQADPCGGPNKWEQASAAIDALTLQSDAADPQYANFGLGLFYGSTTATIPVDCAPSNNSPIMSAIDGTGPGGSTPTAQAIRTSASSNCVNPPANITRTQSADVGTDNSNEGWDLSFTFTGVPNEDIVMEVRVDGDFDATCEFAAVYVDGQFFEYLGTRNCDDSTEVFTVPAALAADGELNVLIDTRATSDTTAAPLPACTAGQNGVSAHCSGANGARVSISHTNTFIAGGATILINDGQPTEQIGGGGSDADAADDAIAEACAHRETAALFVVGLGAGTHEDFNNVLAAAGGTGSCAGDIDPCDDPTNWEALAGAAWDSSSQSGDNDGLCTGAFQADSQDALLAALEEITAALVCTFNIEFFNSGYTSVPPDPMNEYPYLAVEVYNTNLGDTEWICNAEHPHVADASGVCIVDPNDAACECDDPQQGQGWSFTNDTRTFIQFTDYYCDNVRSYIYSEGSTHLACLCQEAEGEPCAVPNNVALGLCPDGVWACAEGIDYCEPETDCCEPGVPCDTGLEGICAEGVIVCNGPGLGTCEQVNEAEAEICDLLDNDCDGEVDEDLGGDFCFAGGIGRCGDGQEECINGEIECVPFTAMPEICNGLDDDCDNEIDNMSESWSKDWTMSPGVPTMASATDDESAAACNFNDVCMCPGGMTDTHSGTTWDEYITAYSPPVCQCGEGLAGASEAGPTTVDEPARGRSDAQAACSVAGGGQGGVAVLLLLGLVGLRRRR